MKYLFLLIVFVMVSCNSVVTVSVNELLGIGAAGVLCIIIFFALIIDYIKGLIFKYKNYRNNKRQSGIITSLVIVLFLSLSSCTENVRARNFGGQEIIDLPKGKKLVMATWKESDLWYLTEDMDSLYKPQERFFSEKSSFGVMEGSIVFIESK